MSPAALHVELEPTAITVRSGALITAHMHWQFVYDYVYIDQIYSSSDKRFRRSLVLMLAKFRERFPGYTVRFDAGDDNLEMQRLVTLLQARSVSRTYSATMKGSRMPDDAETALKKLNASQKAQFTADAKAEAAPAGQNPTSAPKTYHLLTTGYYKKL